MPTLNAFKLHEGMTPQLEPDCYATVTTWRGLWEFTANNPRHREALYLIAKLAFGLSADKVDILAFSPALAPRVKASDPSMAMFWRKANDAAVELDTCDVFEEVMYVMADLTRDEGSHLTHLDALKGRVA